MSQFESEGKKILMSQIKGSHAGGILSCLGEGHPIQFYSVPCLRPTHIREGNLLY